MNPEKKKISAVNLNAFLPMDELGRDLKKIDINKLKTVGFDIGSFCRGDIIWSQSEVSGILYPIGKVF